MNLLTAAAALLAAVAVRQADGPVDGTIVRASAEHFAFTHPALDFTEVDLALDGDDGAFVVWLASDETSDRVFSAALAAGEWSPPVELTPGPGVCGAPRAVAVGAGSYLAVWSAEREGERDLFARTVTAGVPGPLERIAAARGTDAAPAVTWSGQRTWVAWEARREGVTDVFVASRSGAGWGEPRNVTRHPAADTQPTLAHDPSTGVWLAWTSWRGGSYADGNYDVFAQRLDDDAGGRPERVSTAPGPDMFPALQPLDDGLALVWTESRFPLRVLGPIATTGYDRWSDKRYVVAWLDGERFGAPRTVLFDDRTRTASSDVAVPAAGLAEGELLLAYARLVKDASGRNAWSPRLCGVGPRATDLLRNRPGSASVAGVRPAVATRDGKLWRVDVVVDEEQARRAPGHTRLRGQVRALARLERQALAGEPPALEQGDERAAHPGRFAERPRAELGGASWSAWFGNLHVHTSLSRDGRGYEGEPLENYRAVRDLAGLDFAGISDHVESLNRFEWRALRKVADLANDPGLFVAFPGYEWTSYKYGHRNVFFPDTRAADESATFAAQHGRTPDDLWDFLAGRRALTIPHHPSHAIKQPLDWAYRNDEFQRLVEIFQVRGNYEFDGAPLQKADGTLEFAPGHSVRTALDAGHRLGIIASPDHGGGPGLAGVWAEELTRESLFAALHARRTFGTTGAMMALLLSVDGAPQGAEIAWHGGPRALRVRFEGTAPVVELVVVADGEEVYRSEPEARSGTQAWTDETPLAGMRYYYARATQADGHIAWTSPVWITPQ